MSEAKIEFTTSKSGTDKSRASPVPNPTHGRPAREAVQQDTSSRDAWLINLCAEWTVMDAEDDRLYSTAGDAIPGSPECAAYSRFIKRIHDRRHELEATIFFTRALTLEGLRAKAAVIFKRTMRDSAGEPVPEDRASASLAQDILQGVAA
jgi:hypothetical protein